MDKNKKNILGLPSAGRKISRNFEAGRLPELKLLLNEEGEERGEEGGREG